MIISDSKSESIHTILIVDDNPNNLKLLSKILIENGYKVKASNNGKFALESLHSIHPDLVLLDIIMPGMDGFEVCRRLKAAPDTEQLPVIFISALDDIQNKMKGFEMGGVDFITKPFQEMEVLARVKTQLKIRTLQKAQEQNAQNLEKEVEIRSRELFESERRYRQLVSDLPVGIWRISPDHQGRLIMANQALADILGCSAVDQLLKMDASHFFPVSDLFNAFMGLVLKKGYVKEKEFELQKKDRTPITVRITAQLIKDGQNVPTHIDGIMQDITHAKQVENENRDLMKQLMHAQKIEAIGTLAGGIAHDFNNILGAILGYTELAVNRVAEKSVQGYLNKVLNAGHRAKSLVAQILRFSRHGDTSFKSVDLNDVLTEVLSLLKASIPVTIEIKTRVDTQPVTVFADEGQIHQVIMNLCTNAFHAMKDSGGTLHVDLVTEQVEGHLRCQAGQVSTGKFAVLIVRDTGHGISKDVVSKVFDPYFTTKDKGEGTGLGLAVTGSIVKSHKGGIVVDSEPGVGTVFKVYIPVETKKKSPVHGDHMEIMGGCERILFVDDEDFFTDLFSQMLSGFGYEVTALNNSLEALVTFSRQPDRFDLLVTDQSMPGLTGLELARKIHDIRPQFPIIVCTGFSEEMINKTSENLGVSDIVYKPATHRDLAVAIRKVLDQ